MQKYFQKKCVFLVLTHNWIHKLTMQLNNQLTINLTTITSYNGPVLLGCPVTLPPVLEPVADLRECQARPPGQLAFLVRCWVPVLQVTVLQRVPRLLFETVHSLLAVPYRLWQWVFLTQPILVHRA